MNLNCSIYYISGSYLFSCLHFLFISFVKPHPLVTSLFNGSASLAYSPQRLWNRSRFVQIQLREILLDGFCGNLGIIVRNRGVKMVGHMSGSNLVVQEVNQSPRIKLVVRTINGVQCSLNIGVFIIGKVGNIDISMLQPDGRHVLVKR